MFFRSRSVRVPIVFRDDPSPLLSMNHSREVGSHTLRHRPGINTQSPTTLEVQNFDTHGHASVPGARTTGRVPDHIFSRGDARCSRGRVPHTRIQNRAPRAGPTREDCARRKQNSAARWTEKSDTEHNNKTSKKKKKAGKKNSPHPRDKNQKRGRKEKQKRPPEKNYLTASTATSTAIRATTGAGNPSPSPTAPHPGDRETRRDLRSAGDGTCALNATGGHSDDTLFDAPSTHCPHP